ncbi:MAG: CoA transferase [Actinomycetota bacterium]
MSIGPLGGIRVLDLADRSAALAGRILADLGAEVLLVEPSTGNPLRHLQPRIGTVGGVGGESAAHQYFSANKRSVVVDLDGSAGVQRFLDLAATADVIIESEAPGAFADLGLDHASLRSVNPRMIQCSVTPFGLDGPSRDWQATDLIAQAAGGLVFLSGEPRGIPVQGGADVAFAMAGLIAASSISIALHRGEGTHIDVSLQEAVVMAVMQTANPTHWTWHQRVPRRPGLSAALRCADGGHVGHLVRPDRFPEFLAWAESVGIDHGMTVDDWAWARIDAPYRDNPVIATTRALAAKLTRDEFAAGALEADIVCLPVLGLDDLARTEQYIVNEQFLTVSNELLGQDLGFPRSPVDGMEAPVSLRRAPALGEDQELLDDTPPREQVPPVATPPVPEPARALEGLRVVDFTWVLAGPIGTRVLASFGAEVIRIESSKKPDSMRSQIGPEGRPDPDMGGLYNTVNAGKKSLAIDVTTERGKAIVEELIATADVVVNNFRPGAMERMGFGYDRLRELKPDVVMLSLPGAHAKGPWAGRPSMGNILMAASGFNMLTGFPEERPRGIGIAYPDFTGPHLLVTTILAALRERDRTGQGQQINLTQLTGMISLLGAEWLQYTATGELPPRRANRDPNHCPHGVYPAEPGEHSDDEWVAIAVRTDDEWERFATLVDPALLTDDRFATHVGRKANEDALDELIRGWTAGHDKWQLAEELQALGVPAAPVEHLVDLFEHDPQLPRHYQTVHQPSRPEIDIPIDREAAKWVGAVHDLERAPGLGEHNHHVICELLGRTDEDYAELVVDGVLG